MLNQAKQVSDRASTLRIPLILIGIIQLLVVRSSPINQFTKTQRHQIIKFIQVIQVAITVMWRSVVTAYAPY